MYISDNHQAPLLTLVKTVITNLKNHYKKNTNHPTFNFKIKRISVTLLIVGISFINNC